jgi:hypothetical protein
VSYYGDPGPAFLVGCRANGIQFRHSHPDGRAMAPGTAASETETVRSERIAELQRRRVADGERTVPPVSPSGVLGEFFRVNPEARAGKLGMVLGERSAELLPSMMIELPGGDPEVYGPIYQRGRLVAGTMPLQAQGAGVRLVELPGR